MTQTLLEELVLVSLDAVTELSQEAVKGGLRQDSTLATKIVEKVVHKTVEFGMNLGEMKEIQSQGKQDRKACHSIIVEIEKLMYEMSSLLPNSKDENIGAAFQRILDTYLSLPLRLKPIFD